MSSGFEQMLPGDNLTKCSRTGAAKFAPDSGGYNLVSGFALLVEVDRYQESNIKNQNDKSKSENCTSSNVKIEMTNKGQSPNDKAA